jgi:hypothetical protein
MLNIDANFFPVASPVVALDALPMTMPNTEDLLTVAFLSFLAFCIVLVPHHF